jgi:hypothetical protein
MPNSKDFQKVRSQSPAYRRGGDFENGRRWESENKAPADTESQDTGPLEFVRQNPLASVMTGFGLGLGFGLAITLLMTRRELSWYERNISEPLQHLPERLKRVPDSVGSYLQSSWKHR